MLIVNIILVILIPYLICKKYLLDTYKTLLIIFFFAACNVTKVNLIIGQYSLFIMFFLCLPFLYKSKLTLILSGISYFKYSIGYVLFLNYLVTKNIYNHIDIGGTLKLFGPRRIFVLINASQTCLQLPPFERV